MYPKSQEYKVVVQLLTEPPQYLSRCLQVRIAYKKSHSWHWTAGVAGRLALGC